MNHYHKFLSIHIHFQDVATQKFPSSFVQSPNSIVLLAVFFYFSLNHPVFFLSHSN
jgi:hypothetical protein